MKSTEKRGSIPARVKVPPEVFFAYAREDKHLREELAKHLRILERKGVIATWHDFMIIAGDEFDTVIHKHLDNASIVLLLVSPDFLDSEYCYTIEMKRALERHRAGECRVIPVIIRPCSWRDTPLGDLHALPTNGKAITTWRSKDVAFQDVYKGIKTAVEKITGTESEAEKSRGELSKFPDKDDQDVLLQSERLIDEARAAGIKTPHAEELLMRTREELRNGRYRRALELAVQTGKAAEQAELQHKQALGFINATERKLGYNPHLSKMAESLLAEARHAFSDGEYLKALDLAIRCSGEISKELDAKNPTVSQILSRPESEKKFVYFTYRAGSMMQSARRFGINVSEAGATMTKALKLKKTDIANAIVLAEQAYKLASDAVKMLEPKMEAYLEVHGAVLDRWVDGTLTLVNVGKTFVENVKVKILGDVEVEGIRDVAGVKANGKTELSLRVRMKANGLIPLAIQIISRSHLDGKEYTQEIIQQFEVPEKARELPRSRLTQNEGRCAYCKGKISAGFKTVECIMCGHVMHENCARRLGECASCGSRLP